MRIVMLIVSNVTLYIYTYEGIIAMHIYHALINALSAHMIHINLNTIFFVFCFLLLLGTEL